jgi:hypothetical protein
VAEPFFCFGSTNSLAAAVLRRRLAMRPDAPSSATALGAAAALLAALIVAVGASADPIVYAVNRTWAMHLARANPSFATCVDDAGTLRQVPVGSACPMLTLQGTITTDGTLGAWEISEHLVALDLTLSVGTSSVGLDAFAGWPFAEDGMLLGIAAAGPANTQLYRADSGAGWIALGLESASRYDLASGFGLDIYTLLSDWTAERPYAPLGAAVPEASTAVLLGLGLLMLGKAPRAPSALIA